MRGTFGCNRLIKPETYSELYQTSQMFNRAQNTPLKTAPQFWSILKYFNFFQKQVVYCCLLYCLLMTHGFLQIFTCNLWDTTANGSFNSGFIQMLLLSLVLRLIKKKLLSGWKNGLFSTVCISISFRRSIHLGP